MSDRLTLKEGPLLEALLAAQRESESVVSYPEIERWAAALVDLSEELGEPLLFPVTAMAERLVGAAVAAGQGRLRVRSHCTTLEGESVLLLDLSAVTPLQILEAAQHARLLGAGEVKGCAVHLHSKERLEEIDGYLELTLRAAPTPVPAAA